MEPTVTTKQAIIGIITIIVLILISFTPKKETAVTTPHASQPVTAPKPDNGSVEDMLAWQQSHNQYLTKVEERLDEAAKGDPTAEKIAKLFKEQAVAARVYPGGNVQMVFLGEPDLSHPMVPVLLLNMTEAGYL